MVSFSFAHVLQRLDTSSYVDRNKVAVIFDDMISTAGSIIGAANIARYNGAREVYVCATHGVMAGPAIANLKIAPIKQVAITDSIPLTPDLSGNYRQGFLPSPAVGDCV